ncbi:MAG: cobalt ECF transporter T component CbiQ [FCB group bacterium]|nr:cobalt ECF transporter T component CbiQ [FCB group bacterium]
MSTGLISRAVIELRSLDALSRQSTPVHKLDPRVKLILVFAFVFIIMSFPPYALLALVPFFSFPLWMSTAGRIPPRALSWKLLMLAPLAILVGIFNPLLDSTPIQVPFLGTISGGWISLGSIILRFFLSASAGLLLVGTTGPLRISQALQQLKFPKFIGVVFLLIYRYLFILTDEFLRLNQARICRSAKRKAISISLAGSMMGSVLIRTWDRAERITSAMLLRGFSGTVPLPNTQKWTRKETLLLFTWLSLFILFRIVNIPDYSGQVFMRIFR